MPPEENEVILLLGYVTYEAQETEATAHLALSMICGLSIVDSIENLKKIYEKKTLGQFFHTAQEKIGLTPEFSEYMRDYVERRNFIVHNISRTSIFSIYTEEGCQKLHNFLLDFRYRKHKIKLVFMALTELWMQLAQPGYTAGDSLKQFTDTTLFEEITTEFLPKLRTFIGRESPSSPERGRA